jgi:hypothetical protein
MLVWWRSSAVFWHACSAYIASPSCISCVLVGFNLISYANRLLHFLFFFNWIPKKRCETLIWRGSVCTQLWAITINQWLCIYIWYYNHTCNPICFKLVLLLLHIYIYWSSSTNWMPHEDEFDRQTGFNLWLILSRPSLFQQGSWLISPPRKKKIFSQDKKMKWTVYFLQEILSYN